MPIFPNILPISTQNQPSTTQFPNLQFHTVRPSPQHSYSSKNFFQWTLQELSLVPPPPQRTLTMLLPQPTQQTPPRKPCLIFSPYPQIPLAPSSLDYAPSNCLWFLPINAKQCSLLLMLLEFKMMGPIFLTIPHTYITCLDCSGFSFLWMYSLKPGISSTTT
jgi:hypothetical protein